VSTAVGQVDRSSTASPPPSSGAGDSGKANLKRFMFGLLGLIVTVWLMLNAFAAIAYRDMPKLAQAGIGILAGVGGAMLLFFFLNMVVEGLPQRIEGALKPYVFVLPAVLFITVFLIYPTIQTIIYSFANSDTTAWVGFDNYTQVLGDENFQETIFNNVLWIIIVPALTVAMGLAVAVLADKLSPTWEKIAKSIIFLPMAISFVGAATIWRFVYDKSTGDDQVGLFNGILVGLGIEPISWLQESDYNFNDILLMLILVWLQVGFAMVLLSAAIKSVPEETLEAARIDGANETQTFFRVVVPQIKGTLITVFITVLILVMKVFDVVYVMTNGQFGTNVIGLEFFKQIFQFDNAGLASTIVVILMIAVIPVLIYQVKHFREEEAAR
jgi:alpha-glucoside transport system permease protein